MFKMLDFPQVLRCDASLLARDLTGQVMIVTGANSGCGLETARQLTKQGATVIMACRNAERGQKAVEELNNPLAVFLTTMDLASLESIRSFCQELVCCENRRTTDEEWIQLPTKDS